VNNKLYSSTRESFSFFFAGFYFHQVEFMKNIQIKSDFYLPHMEYEGSIGFVPRKIFRMSRAGAVAVAVAVAAAAAVAVERKICATPTA
jgi:hypothetical protein